MHGSLKDARIQAFVALAPALGQGFVAAAQFHAVDAPVLLLGAATDKRTPVATNAQHYHQLLPTSSYVELSGDVGHYVFMNVAKNGLKSQAPEIFEDAPTVNRTKVHQQVAQQVLQFLEQAYE